MASLRRSRTASATVNDSQQGSLATLLLQDKAKGYHHEHERDPHHPRRHRLWPARQGTYPPSPAPEQTDEHHRTTQPTPSINLVNATSSRSQSPASTPAPSSPRRTLSTIPSSSIRGKISSRHPQSHSRPSENAWQTLSSSLYKTICTRTSSWPLPSRDIISCARNRWQRTCAISLRWKRR